MTSALRLPLLTGLFLALLLRAAIPSGWMPAPAASGVSIVLCSAQGPRSFLFDPGRDNAPAPTESCPYAVMAMALPHALPPSTAKLLAVPVALSSPALVGISLRIQWARPPPTAPPAIRSA